MNLPGKKGSSLNSIFRHCRDPLKAGEWSFLYEVVLKLHWVITSLQSIVLSYVTSSTASNSQLSDRYTNNQLLLIPHYRDMVSSEHAFQRVEIMCCWSFILNLNLSTSNPKWTCVHVLRKCLGCRSLLHEEPRLLCGQSVLEERDTSE